MNACLLEGSGTSYPSPRTHSATSQPGVVGQLGLLRSERRRRRVWIVADLVETGVLVSVEPVLLVGRDRPLRSVVIGELDVPSPLGQAVDHVPRPLVVVLGSRLSGAGWRSVVGVGVAGSEVHPAVAVTIATATARARDLSLDGITPDRFNMWESPSGRSLDRALGLDQLNVTLVATLKHDIVGMPVRNGGSYHVLHECLPAGRF